MQESSRIRKLRKSMPRVFVTQEMPNYDISPAKEFGEIVVILPPGNYNFSVDIFAGEIYDRFRDLTEDDYLLLIGDPTYIALVAAIAFEHVHVLNLLKWDRIKGEYLPITFKKSFKRL